MQPQINPHDGTLKTLLRAIDVESCSTLKSVGGVTLRGLPPSVRVKWNKSFGSCHRGIKSTSHPMPSRGACS
jgi:hypothetical protein